MNSLVKFSIDDDGEETDSFWHLIDPINSEGAAKLCTREFFGYGESIAVYEQKDVIRGGVTCPLCISDIKTMKAIRL